jgi:hypothetical protein
VYQTVLFECCLVVFVPFRPDFDFARTRVVWLETKPARSENEHLLGQGQQASARI